MITPLIARAIFLISNKAVFKKISPLLFLQALGYIHKMNLSFLFLCEMTKLILCAYSNFLQAQCIKPPSPSMPAPC